jgi:hypothetical protein
MTEASEEEPFFCLRSVNLFAFRTLPFMVVMITQALCENNERQRLGAAESTIPLSIP